MPSFICVPGMAKVRKVYLLYVFKLGIIYNSSISVPGLHKALYFCG